MTRKSPDCDCTPQRVAVFAGSFRPFTTGHLDILLRGLELFDRVVVVQGCNSGKALAPNDCPAQNLQELLGSHPRVDVMTWDGLTVDAAREVGARFLLRGVRSVADFEYERNLGDINRAISGIETVILVARPELAVVSSSMVRELASYGRDVSGFLPEKLL